MAILKLTGPGPHHDVSIRGAEITVGTVTVDAEALQSDGQVIVDVYVTTSGKFNLEGPGAFAANIVIPGRRYREELVEREGEDGEESVSSTTYVAESLDPNAVEVTIWPKQ